VPCEFWFSGARTWARVGIMDGAAKTKQTTSKNFVAGGARVRSGADAPRADGSESFALLLLLPRAAQLGKVAILPYPVKKVYNQIPNTRNPRASARGIETA